MSKYNVGDKFVIEIDEVFRNDEDDIIHEEELYRIKGFRSLVFDDNGLDKLQKYNGSTISEDTLEMELMKALNDGRNEVWELTKKLWYSGTHKCKEIFGYEFSIDIIEHLTPQEAIAKLEAYEKEQAEIKVGDVVQHKDGDLYLVITKEDDIDYDLGAIDLQTMKLDRLSGKSFAFKKTGKHIDIQSVLAQIGGADD